MRKIYALIMVMIGFFAQNLYAEAFLTPDPSKKYMVQHTSGLFMTYDENSKANVKLVIEQAGAGTCQKFTFEAVEGSEGTYNIKMEDGRYIGIDGWAPAFYGETSEKTNWTISASHEPDCVKFYSTPNNGYLGTDENSAGKGVYTNKPGGDGKSAWKIIEATDGLLTSGLESTIANAEAFRDATEIDEAYTQDAADVLAAGIAAAQAVLTGATEQTQINDAVTELTNLMNAIKTFRTTMTNAVALKAEAVVGSETGSYPQEAADAFDAAIVAGKAAWANGTAESLNAANTAVNDAIAVFNAQRIVFLAGAGKKYYIINTTTQLMMGMSASNEVILDDITGADTQKFEIIPVEGSSVAFNLKVADGSGNYVARKDSWNTTVTTDPTQDVAKIEFEIWDLEKSVYTLKKFGAWGYMAPDGNTAGSLVYTDKSNYHSYGQWQIKEAVDGELLTMGFEASVAAAEKYLADAKPGEEVGQYPQSAIDALTAALNTAKANTAATQEELNAVVATLNAAINTFIADRVYFVPRENTAYRYSVRKYESKYLTNVEGDAKTTAEFAAGNTGQHWTLQPVADLKNTYILKNGGKVLTYDGTMAEMADADAPKWTVLQTQTINNIEYFALVEYDDPTKVLTFGSGKTWAIQNLDKGSNAHQGRFLRVDAANDPNLTQLEYAVYNAKAALASVTRGNAVGQYSDAKCDAFEAVINAADALTGATQEQVDAKVAELNQARTDFINNPNSVIKDELEAAIAAAKTKFAAAEVGIAEGKYYLSAIEQFEAKIAEFEASAGEVSEQEACDALTEEVTAATEAFAANAEVQAVADVLNDAITCCEALYEAEKDNVGTDKGQRPQEAVDAFAAAIAAAKAVTAPTEADLESLIDARTAFFAGAVSVDRTPLRKAIEAAEAEEFSDLKAGDFDGYYPQEKIDSFNEALTAAKAAEADMTKTQEEVDACTTALNTAIAELRKAVVKINFTELDKELAAAEAALAGVTEIGSGDGKCPQAVVDALNAVITEAKAIDRAAINQAGVDAMAGKLTEATAKFSTDLVASTGIADAIADAQTLLDGAEEGFKPGCYPASAIDGLRSAIESASAVAGNAASTQAELIAAVATLKTAVENFKSQAVPANDLTEINATIAEAEQFIAETGSTDFALTYALQEAKNIVANPDDYTKSEVKKAQEALAKALKYARENAGVNGVDAGTFSVRAADGEIIVTGLDGNAIVAVYALDGRMISCAETSEQVYTLAIADGKYAVTIQNEGRTVSRIVIVK